MRQSQHNKGVRVQIGYCCSHLRTPNIPDRVMSNEITGLGTLLSDRPAVREVPRRRRQCVRNFPMNFVATDLVTEGMKLQGEIRRKGNPQPTFFHSTSAHLSLLIRYMDVSRVSFCLPNKKQPFGSKARATEKPRFVSSYVGRTAYRTR